MWRRDSQAAKSGGGRIGNCHGFVGLVRVRPVMVERLHVWMDPEERSGPAAMAVDEWMLENSGVAVLRVYEWRGNWGSIGYFGKLAEARDTVKGVEWVRRRTGGGVVDHRADWTYSLVVPAAEAAAGWRGDESYRMIHRALQQVLADEGVRCGLSDGGASTGGAACFANPVCHDLIGPEGGKLAGAGQRRCRTGLLHQGSVAVGRVDAERGRRRAFALADRLSVRWTEAGFFPTSEIVEKKAAGYACEEWTARR